jgi:hypothetical protein
MLVEMAKRVSLWGLSRSGKWKTLRESVWFAVRGSVPSKRRLPL